MKTVYFHSGCPDGIMSRELFKLSGIEATFVPYLFEKDLPISGDAIFLDCSPDASQRMAFLEAGAHVYDHHASFIEWCDANNPPMQNVKLGDTSKGESGAILTWMHVLGGPANYAELAMLVGISDCYITEHPDFEDGRSLAAMIAFFGNNWSLADYDRKLHTMFGDKRKKDIAILRKKAIHENGYVFMNSTQMSDAAHAELKAGAKMVVGYEITERGTQFSLRGPGAKEIAVKNGGGGHDVAAGFTLASRMHPIDLFWSVANVK